MELSKSILKDFAEITNDKPDTSSKEITVYGTVVKNGDNTYVQLDGTDALTPVGIAMDVEAGDRVVVMIKNHAATITGNITCPASARTATNFMKLTEEGLIVGQLDKSGKPVGSYSLIAPGVYKILDENDNELASFAATVISLGNGMATFAVDRIVLGNGTATFTPDQITLGDEAGVFEPDKVSIANGAGTFEANKITLGGTMAVFEPEKISLGEGMGVFTPDMVSLGNGMATFSLEQITLAGGMANFTPTEVSLANRAAVFSAEQVTLANGMATFSPTEVTLADGAAVFSSDYLKLGDQDQSEIDMCNGKGSMKVENDVFVIQGEGSVGIKSAYNDLYRAEAVCQATDSSPTVGLQALDLYNSGSSILVNYDDGVRITTLNNQPVLVNGSEIPLANNIMACGLVTSKGILAMNTAKTLTAKVPVPDGYYLTGIREIRSNHGYACRVTQFYTDPSTNTVKVSFANAGTADLTDLQVYIEWFALRCNQELDIGETFVEWNSAEVTSL